jgi:hypothetical protein
MRPPFDGPFGGPRGFGRHGRPFGGQQNPPTPEQQAFWAEANALRQQLVATLSAVQNDPAALTQVKTILAQARTALATLASQQSNTTPTSQV